MKKEPWRIVVALLSVAWIIGMWVKKDVAGIYATMSPSDALPLLVTTIAVTSLKVLAIAAAVLLLKWLARKIKK